MRILYDARKVTPDATGVGYVVEKLLEQLLKHKDLEIIAFTRKGVTQLPKLINYKNLIVHETEDDTEYFGLKRIIFEQTVIPNLIKKYSPDILHLTNGFGVPLFFANKKPKIVLTVHDLIPLTSYKELMYPFINLLFKILFSYGINKADAIVTVSKFTADDVEKYFPNAKNIHVVYNGIDSFQKLNNFDEVWSNLQKKYNINQEYILYIGGFAPRKNVLRLLESYNNLTKDKKYKYQLLLCGKFTKNKDIQTQLNNINKFIFSNNLQNQVRLVGYLNLDEKQVLLSKAKFFTYLSLYEGFGLPVLEALSVGTPVLTSKNSAMEEVANKYSLYAKSNNVHDIVGKMINMLLEYSRYKKLAKESEKKLIPSYNWQSAGEKYLNIFENLL